MTEARPKSSKKPDDKLAKALRDNLHRRKAQARARAKPQNDSPNHDDAGHGDNEPGQVDNEPGQVDNEPGQVDNEPGQVDNEPGQVDNEQGDEQNG